LFGAGAWLGWGAGDLGLLGQYPKATRAGAGQAGGMLGLGWVSSFGAALVFRWLAGWVGG